MVSLAETQHPEGGPQLDGFPVDQRRRASTPAKGKGRQVDLDVPVELVGGTRDQLISRFTASRRGVAKSTPPNCVAS